MASEQNFNLNFVKEIEKYPCLYNYKLVAYSLKEVTDTAWNDVGKAVSLSVSECKERWKNLRSVFIRHKKQALNGTATRKPYYLEDAMEFVFPYIKSLNPTSSNASTTATFEVVYDDQVTQDEDNSSSQRQSPELQPSDVASPSSPPSIQLTQLPKKRPYDKRPNEDKLDLQDFFRSKISRIQDNADPQWEANRLFLLSLLPDLSEMSSQQVRTFKRKVLDLIDEVLVSTSSATTVKVEPLY